MASVSSVLRTCGILFVFIFQVSATEKISVEPWIVSLNVVAKSCLDVRCKYLLLVNGSEYLGHNSWRLTSSKGARGSDCDTLYPNYELREIETSQWFTKVQVLVPNVDEKIYFCLRHSKQKNTPIHGTWVHQGGDLFLHPREDQNELRESKNKTSEPNEYQEAQNLIDLQKPNSNWVDLSHDINVNYLPNIPRPTREEAEDLEVLVNNKYVPLNNITAGDSNDINDEIETFNDRRKRDVIKDEINDEIKSFNDRRKRDIIKDLNFEIKRMNDGNIPDRLPETFQNDQNAHNVVNPQISDVSIIRGGGGGDAIIVEGLRIEDSDKEPDIIDNGIPSVLAETKVILRLFGKGLTPKTVIAFTHDPMPYGEPCKFLLKGEYIAKAGSVTKTSALFDITAPSPLTGSKLYICAKTLPAGISDPSKDQEKYLHQGTEHWKMIATHTKLLPLWVTLALILFCLMFSALFSGLNLGLMSLDRTELKIIANTGTEEERNYANAIMPVRDHGNYLLCSILLGNVAVNSTFTILLDDLTSGLFAVIFSTLSIVLLGEITPQAICSRHGLMIGAKSIMITKAVMALTAPLAFPVSKLLDYFLGEEIGSVYNRERLKELVKVTTDVNDLDKDEVNIISGALELRKKKVSDVMTKLEDVFMLPITSVLDFETMSEIIKSGYSRIPVYEGSRVNIVTVLFIKDLAFVDPDDNTPLRTLCQYYQNPCNFVFEDVTLDVMFRQFKEGHKGHMAFVHRINSEGEGDPFYETVGLVTLEDVIEEMIQAEIVDETDVFTDNRSKRRRNRPQNKLQDFAAFAERHENQRIHISPQLTLATFQFLSTSVDAFKPDTVSETVLRRLLKQDVIMYIKMKGKSKREASTYVYQQGKPVDYFVLILEGRVEVTVGRENLVFEAGPFTYFGVQALTQNVGVAESPTPSAMGSLQNINMESMLRHTFVPDYSVRAIVDLHYLAVKRSLYLAAKRATLMEKGALSKGATNEQFDTEVDKGLSGLGPQKTSNVQFNHLVDKSPGLDEQRTEQRTELRPEQRPDMEPWSRSWMNTTRPSPSNILGDSTKHWSQESASDKGIERKSSSNFSTKSETEVKKGKKNFYAKTFKMMNLNHNDDKNEFSLPSTSKTVQESLKVKSDQSLKSVRTLTPRSSKDEIRREASKKAQFKTEKSLLTFHELSDANKDEQTDTHKNDKMEPKIDIECQCKGHKHNSELKMVYKNAHTDNDEKMNYTDVLVLSQLSKIIRLLEKKDLLQSVDEDISISGEHKTPSRQVSPNPPVSASPATRASFSRVSPERNGDVFGRDEQEKLLKH